MARGIALSVLVQQVRHETGRSIATSAGADEKARLEHLLRRTQEFWYEEYDWPFLQVLRSITTVVNQRFYPFPSDMNIEEVQALEDAGRLQPGIAQILAQALGEGGRPSETGRIRGNGVSPQTRGGLRASAPLSVPLTGPQPTEEG